MNGFTWRLKWNCDEISPDLIGLDLPLPRLPKRLTRDTKPHRQSTGEHPRQEPVRLERLERHHHHEQHLPDIRGRVLNTLAAFNGRYPVPAGVVLSAFGGRFDVRCADIIRVLDELSSSGFVIRSETPGGPPCYSIATSTGLIGTTRDVPSR